jgi:hypothetical protein
MTSERSFDTLLAGKCDKATTEMLDNFPVFEVVLNKRGRAWKWHVRTTAGDILMWGSGVTRPAASYSAYRALFLLLQSAPNQSTRPSSPAGRGHDPSGRSRSQAYRRQVQITTRRQDDVC